MFSIYILTYNEELDIAACIESAMLSDDVIVVDSCSRDRTLEIASQYPVRVIEHPFESHGQQRTWMLENIPAKYEWAYILEADERMTPELFQECCEVIQSDQKVGYYAAERVMFMDRWIKHSTQFPRYQLRLLQIGKVWFTDYGHTEREVCQGETSFLQATYPHYTCGKGMSRWIEKHNRYSTWEAMSELEDAQGEVKPKLFGKPIERRRWLKKFSRKLPMRPSLRFCYSYFLQKGFRDGYAGFMMCRLLGWYELISIAKREDIKIKEKMGDQMPD